MKTVIKQLLCSMSFIALSAQCMAADKDVEVDLGDAGKFVISQGDKTKFITIVDELSNALSQWYVANTKLEADQTNKLLIIAEKTTLIKALKKLNELYDINANTTINALVSVTFISTTEPFNKLSNLCLEQKKSFFTKLGLAQQIDNIMAILSKLDKSRDDNTSKD